MSSSEARQIVEAGLERKKTERMQRDAELENQARILRLTINDNHVVKTITEAQQMELQKEEARKNREARAEARALRAARELAVEEIVQKFGILCLIILLVTALTRLNLFFSLALMLGLAVFPAVDIYRLYFPVEEVKK